MGGFEGSGKSCGFNCGTFKPDGTFGPPPNKPAYALPPKYAVTHNIQVTGISAVVFNENYKIIDSFRTALAVTLSILESNIVDIVAATTVQRQRQLAAACNVKYTIRVASKAAMLTLEQDMSTKLIQDSTVFTAEFKKEIVSNKIASVSVDAIGVDATAMPQLTGTEGKDVISPLYGMDGGSNATNTTTTVVELSTTIVVVIVVSSVVLLMVVVGVVVLMWKKKIACCKKGKGTSKKKVIPKNSAWNDNNFEDGKDTKKKKKSKQGGAAGSKTKIRPKESGRKKSSHQIKVQELKKIRLKHGANSPEYNAAAAKL